MIKKPNNSEFETQFGFVDFKNKFEFFDFY